MTLLPHHAGLVAGSTLVALSLLSRSANAQIYDRAERRRAEGPPAADLAVELRFGPYTPRVDDEFSGATPYKDTFGDKTRILVGLEFDWLAWHIPSFGSIGPAFGWGLTGMGAKAPLASGAGRSDQRTSLWIMPMYAVGVVRVDALSEIGVPIAPYGKLGLGFAPWWTSDSVHTSRVDGVVGRDISVGYQFALGLVLNLGMFDPEAQASSESIQNAGLFGEFYSSSLDGFGAGSQMQVGATTWFVGITAEM